MHFADNVKETSGNGDAYRKKRTQRFNPIHCRTQSPRMPPNRIALYNGILRDRVHRIECSY